MASTVIMTNLTNGFTDGLDCEDYDTYTDTYTDEYYNEYDEYDEYCDEYDDSNEDVYYYDLNDNTLVKNEEYKKIYKNPVLNDMNNGAIFDVEKILELIQKYSRDYNDYIFIKKVFKSKNLNNSVKKYIEYSEFIENISELFEDDEDKKNKILNLAKKLKKITKNEIQFDFDVTHPSSELIKFVHQKFENEKNGDLDIFFKFIDTKKSSYEGFLIYKKAMKLLRKSNHGLKIIKKKYLSDEHIINIMEKLCETENLNYNKVSLLKSVSTIKNYNEETFDE